MIDIDLILDADAALRRGVLIAGVVIPVDIENRAVKKGGQEGKVSRIQIAAGEDHIDSFQTFRAEIIPERWRFYIGESENSHREPSFPRKISWAAIIRAASSVSSPGFGIWPSTLEASQSMRTIWGGERGTPPGVRKRFC